MAQLIAGRYELLEQIGQRSVGATFRARDTKLDSVVAVTLLPEQLSEEQLAQAQSLAQRAGELRHEHIAQVLDFGRDGDRSYVVEAFLEAEPLDRVLRDRNGITPADALHIARQLADALAFAHERGVVHGGLTPASVQIEHLVPLRAVLSGFVAGGLAPGREMRPPAFLRYCAPEQLAPQQAGGELDPRVDIFALGLLVFEVFEGKPFIAGTEQAEIVELLLHGRGPLLPQFSRIVPSGVSALVARAIRRVPTERQHNMTQVRRDIDGCLGRLERARNDSPVAAPAEPLNGSSDPGPENEAPELPPRGARKRVAVAREAVPTSRATGEATVARRIAAAASGKARAQRGKVPIAAGGLVAVGLLALVSLILRPAYTRPAASDESGAGARARVEAPIPAAPPAADLDETAGTGAASAAVRLLADAHPTGELADAPMRPGSSAVRAAAPSRARPRRKTPPRIVSFQPRRRGALSLMEGTSLLFGVRGATREPAHRLTYTWLLDGRRMSRAASWRFVAPPAGTGTAHTVQVQVNDGAGPKGPRMAWHVDVFPRMADVNVRDWLGRLAEAWERKDIATLRLYGVVTSDAEAAAVRKRVSRYDHYRVAIGNATIRTDGRYASVAFDRTELDGCGKTISSQRESLELEKYPSGFIAVRAPR